MIYLNLDLSLLSAPEYVGAEPVERATWISLLGWCCGQENGGRIIGARAWRDRRWQQTCGVTLEEVETPSELYWWEGDDLVVWAYPVDAVAKVQAKREAGRKGGQARTYAKAEKARENGQSGGRPKNTEPETEAKTEAKTEALDRKTQRKESKGKESNVGEARGREAPTPPPALDAEVLAEASLVVASLHPAWAVPVAWSRQECRALLDTATEWVALPQDTLETVRAYLAWQPPANAGHWWQPYTRSRAAETLADLLSAAMRWRSGPGRKRPAKPAAAEKPAPPPRTPEELAEIEAAAREIRASLAL